MKVKELIMLLNGLTKDQQEFEITHYNGEYGTYDIISKICNQNGYMGYYNNGQSTIEYFEEKPYDHPGVISNPNINPISLIVIY